MAVKGKYDNVTAEKPGRFHVNPESVYIIFLLYLSCWVDTEIFKALGGGSHKMKGAWVPQSHLAAKNTSPGLLCEQEINFYFSSYWEKK